MLLAAVAKRHEASQALSPGLALFLRPQLGHLHRHGDLDDHAARRRYVYGDAVGMPDERQRADPIAVDTVRDAGQTHAGKNVYLC